MKGRMCGAEDGTPLPFLASTFRQACSLLGVYENGVRHLEIVKPDIIISYIITKAPSKCRLQKWAGN